MKVLVTQPCPILFDPWTVAHQGPLSMEFSRQEYWSGYPFPSPGDLPDPGIKPKSRALPADSLSSEPSGKHFFTITGLQHFQCCWKVQATSQLSSVQLLSHVWLFATPWITAHQASLSITNSQSSLKLTCIESVMPSSHLILCHPLLLLPPIPICNSPELLFWMELFFILFDFSPTRLCLICPFSSFILIILLWCSRH